MILCIDSTSSEAGITLVGKKVFRESLDPRNSSGEVLIAIDKVLKMAKANPSDLTAVFVIKGPGSFTGLRVGIAIANQFAHQLGIPILGLKAEEWWSKRTHEADFIYLQTMNKEEVYIRGMGKYAEKFAASSILSLSHALGGEESWSDLWNKSEDDILWLGQISQEHKAQLPSNFQEITNLLSPEETWAKLALSQGAGRQAPRLYDLVLPFYGKEAKITSSSKKFSI